MVGLQEGARRTDRSGEFVAHALEGGVGGLYWTGLGTGLGAVRPREADLVRIANSGGKAWACPNPASSEVPPSVS